MRGAGRRLKYLIFLMLMAFSMHLSAALPDSLLFRDFATQFNYSRHLADSLRMNFSYEQALENLRESEKWAHKKGDQRLHDLLQCCRYTLSIYTKDTNNSYAENGLLELLTHIDEKNQHLRAFVLSQLGRYYWINKRYAESFEYELNAYKLYSGLTVGQFPAKVDLLHDLGGHYYHFRDFATSKKFFLQAFREAERISPTNTLALCYQQLSEYDSAEYYFKRAFTQAEKEGHGVWTGIISGNLGQIFYQRKQYAEAIALFDSSISKCTRTDMEYNAAHALSSLCHLYLLTGEKEKAVFIADSGYHLIHRKKFNESYELVRNAYPRFARVFAAAGRHHQAYLMLDSASVAKDSINRRSNALLFAGVQHKLDAQEHLQEQQKHEREEKFQALIRNGLIGTLILIGIIAGLLINRQRLKYRHNQEQLQVEKLQAQAELLNASSQLEDFTKSITEKNELIEKFRTEMKRIQAEHGDGLYLNEPLAELQRSTILTDDEWSRFQSSFEKVHKGFLKRLKQKVQGLSPVETRFMLLSRLRLSTREMAAALGISHEAARQNRERLRLKLALGENDNSLEDFAASI